MFFFITKNRTKSLPNEKFAYSNIGYVLLGQIIENVSKTSYEKYIKTHIIDKLGIENELGFEINEQNHAKGYQKKWSFIKQSKELTRKSRWKNESFGL